MNEFLTIATFNYPHEIIVLKSILQNEGILFSFQNENLIAANPFASFAYGGIILKVHPNDFEIVQAILDNLNSNLEIV
jgi:flagellar biosynthesis/type III secretory pathway protein FliH